MRDKRVAELETLGHRAQRVLAGLLSAYVMAGFHAEARLSHLAIAGPRSATALAVGLVAAIVLMPIPFGNLPPALALMFTGLGLVLRDGVAVVLGLPMSGVARVATTGLLPMAWVWGRRRPDAYRFDEPWRPIIQHPGLSPMAEFKKRLRRWLPTAQTLEQTRGFGWLSPYLREHPRLWVLHRRGVALGVALGIGIGVFPVPLQMPVAMLAAVALRANVAAAAAATWLTNPFTMAPIWGLAALLGSFVVPQAAPGTPVRSAVPLQWTEPLSWPAALWEQIISWGPALLAGFPLAALVLGTAAYMLVYWGWAVLIRREQLRRRARTR